MISKISSCFLIGSLLWNAYQLYPVITQTEVIKFDGGKNCFLFYNVHKSPHLPEDKQQLSSLLEILKSRENCKEDLRILVEQPLSLVKLFDPTPSISANLGDDGKHLKYTTIENAEIRCAALAALYVLQQEINPYDLCDELCFDSSNEKLILKNIILRNLEKEYWTCRAQVDSLSQSPLAGATVTSKLKKMENAFCSLEKGLAGLGYGNIDFLLSVARRIHDRKGGAEIKEGMSRTISSVFSPLFELYLFKQIIEIVFNNEKRERVALIAGSSHVQFVKQMLCECGGRQGERRPQSFIEERDTPLVEKDLDIFSTTIPFYWRWLGFWRR